MDEEIKRILQSPSAWLFGVAVAAFCGVWWATMTPNKTNISLVIGVLAFSGAVFFHSRLATEPMLARSLLSIVVAAVLGLVVYNVAWDRSAGESKKAAVSVDNIESKVDEWLRGYHIKFTQLPKGGSFFFRYDAVTQGGTPIAFGRPIEHPTFLWIQAELDASLTADQWAWISRLSRSEREQLDRDLAAEFARANVDTLPYEGKRYLGDSLVIDAALTPQRFYDAIRKTENAINACIALIEGKRSSGAKPEK